MERKNQHSLLEWPPFQPQKRHKTSDFIFLVEIYVSRNQKKKIKFLLSATNINTLEDNLATPRKAGYKPPMSQESCQGISPKELLYENVHILWPSLSARSGILFKPSPSTYTGDLGESG